MKKYLRHCRYLFPIYGKSERHYLKKLKKQVQEYSFEFPDATYDDFVQQFGTPSDIIVEYYDTTNYAQLLHKLNLVKHMKVLFISFICLLIIFLSYRSYVIYQAYLDAKETTILHEETNIY